MANYFTTSDLILQMSKQIVDYNIIFQYTDNIKVKGNQISIKNSTLTNFGSCSYLGLEFDHRLREGSKRAIDKYGTQFSESRTYVSIHAYKELEEKLEKVFDANVVITPTTTLGHFANLPVLINPTKDAVIVDHQVHNSVQMAVQMLKGSGTHVELIRHNRVDLLETRLIELTKKYHNIWYLADGIYSMFGDRAPILELEQILNKYPQFRLYIDDAHGMSVFGKNGCGYVLSKIKLHPQMILGTSLNKAFASGGGVMVYPTKELANRVRVCGGPMITSGPIQPAMLGAGIASADIHLSNEIIDLQADLQEKIKYASLLLSKTNLPVISESDSPVFFIAVALPKVGYNLVQRLFKEGFYVNLGLFPAVPLKNTGIRFTITRLHSFSQIKQLIEAFQFHWEKALIEEGVSIEEVFSSFKQLSNKNIEKENKIVSSLINQTCHLTLHHYKSIKEINPHEWDAFFYGKGNFDYKGLEIIEAAFTDLQYNEPPTKFDYFIIKDRNNQIVLATFTTCNLQKDDMLAPAEISKQIEQVRKTNQKFLTSFVIQTGSMFTEGEHIYVDKTSAYQHDAYLLLLDALKKIRDEYNANSIILRDFKNLHQEDEKFFSDNGYLKVNLPASHVLDITQWDTNESFLKSLKTPNRYYINKDLIKKEHLFTVEVSNQCSAEEVETYYQLYLKVKEKNLAINVFELPKILFYKMFEQKTTNWEVIKIYVKEDSKKLLASVTFCYKSVDTYMPVLIGMDYAYLNSHHIYKQSLYQMIKRAKSLKAQKVNLGFGSSLEKRKFGAKAIETSMAIQIKDSFNMSVIAEMEQKVFAI